MKIVYINYMPLREKMLKDWFISDLIDNGYPVEYWDVGRICGFQMDMAGTIRPDYVRTIENRKILRDLLRAADRKETVFIPLMYYDGNSVVVYRMLSRFDCRMFFIDFAGLPELPKSGTVSWARKLFTIALSVFQPRLFLLKIRHWLAVFYRKTGQINHFETVFASGKKALEYHPKNTKVVPINFCDYDAYLRERNKKDRIISEKYAVFLDIYLPFHPDFRVLNQKQVEASSYFASLNRFFDAIEAKFGLEVVIAEHPKSDYSENNVFGGRKHFKFKTNELVRDAELVLSHHSTSVGYAAMYRKPVLFVYTDEFEKLYKETCFAYLKKLNELLGGRLYNADRTSGNHIQIPPVDEKRYEQYLYDFMTTRESENTVTGDIVVRTMRESE